MHRLVAETFLLNQNYKKEVNHIDGNKNNNNINNLEWVTSSENKKHAYKLGLNKITDTKRKKCSLNGKIASKSNQIKIIQYDLNYKKIKMWNSATEVQNVLGIDESSIRKCCNGKRKTAGKYIWVNAV